MDKEELATEIVERILPKYFQFILWESEISEEGVFHKNYTEKIQNIFNDIINLLEKYENNTSN